MRLMTRLASSRAAMPAVDMFSSPGTHSPHCGERGSHSIHGAHHQAMKLPKSWSHLNLSGQRTGGHRGASRWRTKRLSVHTGAWPR